MKLVHFVLDEAASLGRMDTLDDALDKYRGFGVRLQFYYQSLGQLKKCWPDGADQTLLSNTSQVFFGVNDNETAKYVSERGAMRPLRLPAAARAAVRRARAATAGNAPAAIRPIRTTTGASNRGACSSRKKSWRCLSESRSRSCPACRRFARG